MREEQEQGLMKMKYPLNHSYLFEYPLRSALYGFTQFLIGMFVEVINFVLVLAADNAMDVVLNFVALQAIAQFDEFLSKQLASEPLMDLVSNLELKVERTTSRRDTKKVLIKVT